MDKLSIQRYFICHIHLVYCCFIAILMLNKLVSKRTTERNCKQVIYSGYHSLPGKIWYKRYDQYSDLKQSKKKSSGPQSLVRPRHHGISSASILYTIVHHKHPKYHVVTLQTSKSLSPSPVGVTGDNLNI